MIVCVSFLIPTDLIGICDVFALMPLVDFVAFSVLLRNNLAAASSARLSLIDFALILLYTDETWLYFDALLPGFNGSLKLDFGVGLMPVGDEALIFGCDVASIFDFGVASMSGCDVA